MTSYDKRGKMQGRKAGERGSREGRKNHRAWGIRSGKAKGDSGRARTEAHDKQVPDPPPGPALSRCTNLAYQPRRPAQASASLPLPRLAPPRHHSHPPHPPTNSCTPMPRTNETARGRGSVAATAWGLACSLP